MVTATTGRADTVTPVSRVLLRRRHQVYVPGATGGEDRRSVAGVRLLEADALDRGYLLSASLTQALTALDPVDLVSVGSALLADLDALLGSDQPHVPQFRKFPHSVPEDTGALYVDRVAESVNPVGSY